MQDVNSSFLNTSKTTLLWMAGVFIVVGGGAYYFLLHQKSSPDTTTPSGSVVLLCPGVKIPMPEKWTELAPAVSSKLDANGCSKSVNGCLCIKKDSNLPSSKNVVFSTLVNAYPAGFTLDSLVANAGFVSDVKKFNFLGYPAVRFTVVEANQNQKIITTAFLKDQKLYEFDFVASENAFTVLWPDMEAALQNISFQ